MYLDNRGWGIKTMLIFCAIIILACFISYSIYRETFGSVGALGNFQAAKAEKNVVERSSNTSQNISYGSYERKMVKASKKYMDDNNIKVNEDETLIVNLQDLTSRKYIDQMVVNNKKCEGYLKVTNEIVKPYLSCDGYRTTEFSDTYLSEKND